MHRPAHIIKKIEGRIYYLLIFSFVFVHVFTVAMFLHIDFLDFWLNTAISRVIKSSFSFVVGFFRVPQQNSRSFLSSTAVFV